MRWDALFDDLEAQWSAQQAQLLEAEVAETVEWQRAQISLVDRLRAGLDTPLQLGLKGGEQLDLLLRSVGADWVSGRAGAQSLLVPVRAIITIEALPLRAAAETTHTRRLLGIGSPLRALARMREPVVAAGADGELGRGVIAHVGADHFDVAVRPTGAVPGRGQSLRRTITLDSLVLIRSA